MSSIRRTVVSVGAALALVGLSACSTGDETAPGGAGGTGSAGKEVKKVGLMLQDISNPFFASMQNRMKAEGSKAGVEVNVQDGRQDLGTQNDQIDTFVQQGVDLIIINAVDSKGIGSAIARAKAAGIKVVAVDVGADNADATVTTDNVMAGTIACESLVKALGAKGNILFIEGTPTTAPQERAKGCEQVLAKNPGVKIVARQAGKNDRATALNLATDMLTANKDVQGVFAINDPTALGAELAAKQAGRTGLKIVGVDAAPEAVTALKDPNSMLIASAAQQPGDMVAKAFEVGKDLVAGKQPAQNPVLLKPFIVTKDSVKDYKGW